MRHTEVRNLQEILKREGFLAPTTPTTDFFGFLTQNAVQAFQRQNNLPATGYVGSLTLRKLKETQGALPSVPTPPPSSAPPSIIFTTGQNLFRGSRNADVLTLQRFLTNQGLLNAINQTGFFGLLTEQAVKEFQCAQSIICQGTSQTTGWGVAGPKTRARMNLTTTQTPTPTTDLQALQQKIEDLKKQIQLLQQ